MERFHSLSSDEADIFLHKGTEPPFSSEMEDLFEEGIYLCRQCDLPLFMADSKFQSGCGWPSFDVEIEGNVIHRPDGNREEVLCRRCQGHLGHVFRGEKFTQKNTRYCINGLSIAFMPATVGVNEIAYFAAGCFWSVQYHFSEQIGVVDTSVGYMNGLGVNPTYKDVCTNQYGFAEAVRVLYDPKKVAYETLLALFFKIHDATQKDRQGPDIGRQYRSALFYMTEKQKKIAAEAKDRIPGAVTEIAPASRFYLAEEAHQHYLKKRGEMPHCGLA